MMRWWRGEASIGDADTCVGVGGAISVILGSSRFGACAAGSDAQPMNASATSAIPAAPHHPTS
jgi:hypothetical protein